MRRYITRDVTTERHQELAMVGQQREHDGLCRATESPPIDGHGRPSHSGYGEGVNF